MNTKKYALNILPLPAVAAERSGRFSIDQSFRIELAGTVDKRLVDAASRFMERLGKQIGMWLSLPSASEAPGMRVGCAELAVDVQSVEDDESYRIDIGPSGVHLQGANVLGVMHGFETILQLVNVDFDGFFLTHVTIEDRPRFPWRGLMLDVTRHFMPVVDVKRTLDLMAAVKLNVLHLHLTDDQGFNIECRAFPKLHELGHNGGCYRREDIAEIVEHASARGIRVVPEFDVPGHTAAWFAGYPHLAGYPGEYAPDGWYGSNPRNSDPHYCPAMNPAIEETYTFLDTLFGEMAALFPDRYFHIGGDEVTPHHWLNNPSIVEFMKANGFADPNALQAHFNSRVVEIVRGHGKIMIGWDEVFHPGIPSDIAIQSWRGAESLTAAAKAGHPAILSNGYYLDLMYSSAEHYRQDPHAGASELTEGEKANILGGEACLWSEYVTPEILDDRLWPRLAGIAERFWSPADVDDVDFLYARFPSILRHLTWTGLRSEANRSMMFERMLGTYPRPLPKGKGTSLNPSSRGELGSARGPFSKDIERDLAALRVFAECIEPAKGYVRRGYKTMSPLNRLIDAIPAESLPAWEFGRLCDTPLENVEEIGERLRRWKGVLDNVGELVPRSALTKAYAGVVDEVRVVVDMGLLAIDYIECGAGVDWGRGQISKLEEAGKPMSELVIALVPAVKKLVAFLLSPLVA